MGRQAWLSVLGLYEYDNTIFSQMYVPTGMDRQVLIDNILLECAELEVLLPDPTVMKKAIAFWSASQKYVWDELFESTQFNYNPIWNKDGIIEETETRDLTATRDLKSTDDGTDTMKRSAYNSSTFQNHDQETTDHDYTDTGTVKDTGTIKRSRTEKGNIGITTTQQMIQEQREVVQFDIYGYIVRSFKERFCIMVY